MNWLKVMLIVLPILSVIWISFFSYGTIPTLIALILGIIIPAVFWGIAYSSALVISWWLMLIALFFAILFSAGIVLLSHADLSMTKVEGGEWQKLLVLVLASFYVEFVLCLGLLSLCFWQSFSLIPDHVLL